MGLSYMMREVIKVMQLMKELKWEEFPIESTKLNIECKFFKYTSGALDMSKSTSKELGPRNSR